MSGKLYAPCADDVYVKACDGAHNEAWQAAQNAEARRSLETKDMDYAEALHSVQELQASLQVALTARFAGYISDVDVLCYHAPVSGTQSQLISDRLWCLSVCDLSGFLVPDRAMPVSRSPAGPVNDSPGFELCLRRHQRRAEKAVQSKFHIHSVGRARTGGAVGISRSHGSRGAAEGGRSAGAAGGSCSSCQPERTPGEQVRLAALPTPFGFTSHVAVLVRGV